MSFSSTIREIKHSNKLNFRVVRSGFWVAIGKASEQSMRLLRNIILARILVPDAFGLMALILTVNGLFEAFTEVGIKEAIIQNPRGHERTYLNGAWWLSFMRGVLLYIIFYFTSPWIAKFYDNPDMTNMLRVAFLSMIFISSVSPRSSVAMKELRYFKWAVFFNGGGIVGIISALLLSMVYPNVWALIFGFVIENISRFIFSYILFPFRPGFHFDKNDIKDLFKFASGMVGLPILTLIFLKTDIIAVGKICTMKELGLYSMAVGLAWVPFQFITVIFSRIMLPVFSERQQDKGWINKWTLNSTYLLAVIGFPLFTFSCFYGESLLVIIYGEKYGAVAIPFSIVFLVALLRTCSVPIAVVYLSSGNPKYHRYFTGIRAFVIVAIIIPMTNRYGLIGASSSALIAIIISYVFQLIKMSSLTGLNIKNYISRFIIGMGISLSVFFFWLATNNFNFINPYLDILPGIIGCLISYLWGFRLISKSLRLKTGAGA